MQQEKNHSATNCETFVVRSYYTFLSYRACDGTVRIWSLPNTNHQFLQHTCVFEKGDDRRDEEINGSQISNLVWSSNGKLIAASSENIINVWALAGMMWYWLVYNWHEDICRLRWPNTSIILSMCLNTLIPICLDREEWDTFQFCSNRISKPSNLSMFWVHSWN